MWKLLEAYEEGLEQSGTGDHNDVLSAALRTVTCHPQDPPWSAVLVDEVQDLNLLGLRLCRALAGDGTDSLFLVGDGQQALYPGGFTLADAGISVTGRAVVLRTNYRNTRQILDSARDLVADRAFTDLDTVVEPGRQEVEVLRDGRPVRQEVAPHRRGLVLQLVLALRRDADDGVRRGDMAVLCHTHGDLGYLTRELTERGIPLTALETWSGEPDDRIKIGTVNRSKGLDFAAVYLPRLDRVGADDGAEHTTAYLQREYVARTRPRDRLWIGRVHRPQPGTTAEPGRRRSTRIR